MAATGDAAAAELRAAAAAVAAGEALPPPPPPQPPALERVESAAPPRSPFARQLSGRVRSAAGSAAFAAMAASRVASGSSTLGGRRQTGESISSDGAGGTPASLLSPTAGGANGGFGGATGGAGGAGRAGTAGGNGADVLDAVRASLDQLGTAVRASGGRSAQLQQALLATRALPSEWYAELAAALGALAREAERAAATLDDEGEDAEANVHERTDSTMLRTQA